MLDQTPVQTLTSLLTHDALLELAIVLQAYQFSPSELRWAGIDDATVQQLHTAAKRLHALVKETFPSETLLN